MSPDRAIHSGSISRSSATRMCDSPGPLPVYCMFAGRTKRRPGKLQVVTLVHCYLAARASLLEITEQLVAVEAAGPEGRLHGLEGQLHALLLIEPKTGASLMVVNVRQFQAAQPGQQAALLDLADKILASWAGDVDAVIVGGDFNAITCPRSG